MLRRIIIIALLAIGMWKPAQGQATEKAYDQKLQKLYKFSVPVMQPTELKAAREYSEKIILLDTRSPEEFEVSHLEGATFVDYGKVKKKDLEAYDRDAMIVVYCTVGYRSERIGERLKKLGFDKVYNLYGGIFEWVNQGNSVIDASGKETQRVHAYNEDWGRWLQEGEKVYK